MSKKACTFCGSTNYEWAAVPTDDTRPPEEASVDACSNCHDFDEAQSKLIVKPIRNEEPEILVH